MEIHQPPNRLTGGTAARLDVFHQGLRQLSVAQHLAVDAAAPGGQMHLTRAAHLARIGSDSRIGASDATPIRWAKVRS